MWSKFGNKANKFLLISQVTLNDLDSVGITLQASNVDRVMPWYYQAQDFRTFKRRDRAKIDPSCPAAPVISTRLVLIRIVPQEHPQVEQYLHPP